MRRLVAAVAVMVAVTATPAFGATTRDASISNLAYRPGSCAAPQAPGAIRASVGDTVRWTNCDAAIHTVTADDNSFSSGSLNNGESFSKTFSQTGFFNYHCEVHSSMHGTVIVEPAAPAATTSPTARPATTTTAPTRSTSTTPPTASDEAFTTTTPGDPTTTTSTADQQAIASKDKGASGPLVAVLLLAVGAVIGGGVFAVRRMRQA